MKEKIRVAVPNRNIGSREYTMDLLYKQTRNFHIDNPYRKVSHADVKKIKLVTICTFRSYNILYKLQSRR